MRLAPCVYLCVWLSVFMCAFGCLCLFVRLAPCVYLCVWLSLFTFAFGCLARTPVITRMICIYIDVYTHIFVMYVHGVLMHLKHIRAH